MLIADDAVARIIEVYTQEAGVRGLERQIGAVCRWAAMRVARAINGGVVETDTLASELCLPIDVTSSDLGAILGVSCHQKHTYINSHYCRRKNMPVREVCCDTPR